MTQTDELLSLLKRSPEGVTALDALEIVGSFRLAARINDLRGKGHVIDSTMVPVNGKRVARYRLRILKVEREGKTDQYVNLDRARAQALDAQRATAWEEQARAASRPRVTNLRIAFGEDVCRYCKGTGGTTAEACWRCGGSGKV